MHNEVVKSRLFSVMVFLLLLGTASDAELPQASAVKPAPIFGSHMVLQQNELIQVWGSAGAGQKIEVILGDEQQSATADDQGAWLVAFPPRTASKTPIALQINEIRFDDILIGEIWLCSGQSNMGVIMKNIEESERYLADADNPNLRIASHGGASGASGGNPWKDPFPEASLARCNVHDYFKSEWVLSTSKTASSKSAVAWILGSELQKKLDVPVGVIVVGVGGSALNNWIDPEALKVNPATASLFEKDWLTNEDVRFEHRQRAIAAFQNVMGECKPRIDKRMITNGGAPYIVGEMPYRWICEPGFLFEAGIAPLKHLAFRGVLWYQGEADADNEVAVERAKTYFPMLVNSWRNHFGRAFPFFYVQLPGFEKSAWPLFRELQRNMERQLSNMTMIVTLDTGNENNIHPKDKGPVAMRAVHMALRNVYGMKDLPGFPEAVLIQLESDCLTVRFAECGTGFKPVDETIPGFEVADGTGVYHGADARIVSPDTVEVHSPVAAPVALRYAWQPFPNPPLELFNSAGLPVGPFHVALDQRTGPGNTVFTASTNGAVP